MNKRSADLRRTTRETDISLALTLEGEGAYQVSTGIGFFDHMLELFTKHGGFNLSLSCKGDLKVDGHHTVEDAGLSLGEALLKCVGDKRGIKRYGYFILPMDEALALAAVDLSGRPCFVLEGGLPLSEPGGFPPELVTDFFKAVCDAGKFNLHLKLFYGRNSHHCIEALFKATARALSMAVSMDPGKNDIPSTKGVL